MRGGSVTAPNRQASFKQHKICLAFIKHITTNVCPRSPLDLTAPGYLQSFLRTSELAKNKVSVDGAAVRKSNVYINHNLFKWQASGTTQNAEQMMKVSTEVEQCAGQMSVCGNRS